MTREEAIDLLDNLVGMVEDNHNSNYDTALQMAIKALEQEPVLDNEQEDKQKQASEIKVGDEVITEYAEHAVAVRDTYYIGADREPFTLIWFGTHMSSCPVNKLTKTGKHYPQIAEIMEELRGAENDE